MARHLGLESCASAGTIGLEILEDLADVDTVIIPMSGGSLISGIATAIKETCLSVPLKNTIADGLRISVPGQNPYPIVEKYGDEIVLIEDEHIIAGMRALVKDAKLIAEPAASIGIGALLAGSVKRRPDEKSVWC